MARLRVGALFLSVALGACLAGLVAWVLFGRSADADPPPVAPRGQPRTTAQAVAARAPATLRAEIPAAPAGTPGETAEQEVAPATAPDAAETAPNLLERAVRRFEEERGWLDAELILQTSIALILVHDGRGVITDPRNPVPTPDWLQPDEGAAAVDAQHPLMPQMYCSAVVPRDEFPVFYEALAMRDGCAILESGTHVPDHVAEGALAYAAQALALLE